MTNWQSTRRPASRLAGLAVTGSLVVLATGCGTSQPTAGASHQPRAQVSASAAGTSGAGTSDPEAAATRAEQRALAVRYLAIARPANRRLDAEVDGYGDHERDDLARARADLRSEAATERRFDAQLLALRSPSLISLTARSLVRANQRRIDLTERQARAPSLASMRSLDRRHQAADAAVEDRVRLIRLYLSLPPPSTS